jgi:uncharacterized membrane protein YccC
MIVFLLHAVSPDSATLALDRGLDTIIGGAIGLGAYVLWPTWSARALATSVGVLIDAQREYLDAVMTQVESGVPADLRGPARRARVAFGDAQAALDASRGEPVRPGHDHAHDSAVLAGLRRLVFAIHALRLASADPAPPHPELHDLAVALDEALLTLQARAEGRTRTFRRPAVGPPARAGLPPLRQILRRSGAQTDEALGVALDELVDAVGSVAAIVSGELAQPSVARAASTA